MRRDLLLLLALSLPLTLATAQDSGQLGRDEVVKRVAEFDTYYANQNEHVRRAAVEDLGETDHADVVKSLLTALGDKELIVRSAAVEALAKQTSKEAAHELTIELGRNRPLEYHVALLEVMKKLRPPVAYDAILKLADDRKFELKLLAAEILGLMPSQGGKSEKLLVPMLKDSEAQLRLVAIEALKNLRYEGLADLCLQVLAEESDWRVKASALEALPDYREKRIVAALIEYLRKEEGRIVDDTFRALQALTGEDIPPKIEMWEKWWAKVSERYVVPSEADIAARKKKLKEAMAAYGGGGEDDVPYHGIHTRSQRILFVLDVSFSMKDKVVLDSRNPEKMKAFEERYRGFETKIELAREELITVVAGLKPHVKFNIILFNSEVKPWKPGLVSANGGNRSAAIKFLSRLSPEWLDAATTAGKGQTNTFGALNLVFGLKDEPQIAPSKNHTVDGDTVFFLTDGMPEVGTIVDPQALLDYALEVNRTAKIVFHTITFGNANGSLLEPLATRSGGQYVVISQD